MNQDVREEIWRHIQGYEGSYAVSNRGRVMNLKKNKVLKPVVNVNGYAKVNLYKNKKQRECRIHRLVAGAFLPNPNNLPEVNHIDECKTNNDVTNLSWCTASQNIRHSIHQQSCKVNQLTLDGEFIREWKSFREIERDLGFSKGNINMCCKGRYKTSNGYRWQYADGLHQRRVNRPIAALTKDGEFVAEYKSVADASRCLKICNRLIRNCLNGTYKSTHGLRFIYID